jgi:4-carboxymuconolactone decarboxylase
MKPPELESLDRYRTGLDMLLGMSAEKADLISDQLASEAPEFVRLMVEFAFGDILARRGLDLRARLFVAIGALAAQGRAPNQLRYFVSCSLRSGCSREELVEALMQVALFAGFAAASNALEACRDLLLDNHDDCSCGAPAAR